MTTRLMKASAIGDTFTVERTRKPARPAAKPAVPRKRAAKPAPPQADRGRRGRRLAFASAGLVVVVAASFTAGFFLLRGDRADQNQAAVSFASSHDGPVYWAGTIPAHQLDLSTTSAGTFVRYLPLGAAAGDSARTITVATYPMLNAYTTAAARAKNAQMTSRETAGGGVVVWNLARPTSVYLAFPGVPQLVEVYAPDADQARTLALSGRIRPVR
jgi:hypothetical protein